MRLIQRLYSEQFTAVILHEFYCKRKNEFNVMIILNMFQVLFVHGKMCLHDPTNKVKMPLSAIWFGSLGGLCNGSRGGLAWQQDWGSGCATTGGRGLWGRRRGSC
jgi:hypothetical protein